MRTRFCFQAAARGEAGDVEYLVRSLSVRVERMAAYYARCCGEDADDLRQEAWIGLMEALPRLDTGIGEPEQYLIQYARWRMLDSVRRAKMRRCDSIDPWEEESQTSRACPAATAIASTEFDQFSRGLHETQRNVLDCLLRGLTWREAAGALGCTSANVAYHVRQIRARYENWCEGV